MKKLLSLLSFVLILALGAKAQSDNGLVGKAISAYRTECGTFNGPIEGQANVVSACFVDGFITEVTLVRQINCQVVDCTVIRLAPLARVTFGCDGEIISIECLN